MSKQQIRFISLVIFISLLLLSYLYLLPQRNYLTVSEVLERQEELKDQRITVRGAVDSLLIVQTVQGCFTGGFIIYPDGTSREYGERHELPGCSCNESWARNLTLVDSDNIAKFIDIILLRKGALEIQVMNCHANDCTMTCTPMIRPAYGSEYEFSGILKETGSHLELTEVEIQTARQNVKGSWEPISTESFTLTLN